jgi:hypothetical protein
MIVYWLIYIFLSLLLSFCLTKFLKQRFSKILVFSISLSILCSFWFSSPGEQFLAPVISIFLLETFISDSNGILRLIRPFMLFFVVFLITSIIFWKRQPKI